jgi:uncharacterized OB-fold protein
MATQRPMPEPDEASEAFYEAAARGSLLLKKCGRCAAALGPDARFCSECLSEDVDWLEASGQGKVLTFGVMHQQFPGFEDAVPYNIAVVQLDEGPRMSTNIVGCANEDVRIGMPVRVRFEDAGNGTMIPRFAPA